MSYSTGSFKSNPFLNTTKLIYYRQCSKVFECSAFSVKVLPELSVISLGIRSFEERLGICFVALVHGT